MSHHLPECFLSNPCNNEEGHSIITVIGGVPLGRDLCEACMADCICDRLRQAEQRGFDKGFTDGMTWRIGGPSAVEYWQGQERDRIRTEIMNDPTYPIRTVHSDYDEGYRDGTNDTVRIVLAVIDPKDEPDD